MPISYGVFEKQLKLLPLILYADGSASIAVRFGYVDNNEFTPTTEKTFNISPIDVSSILDTIPTPTLTRRNDLALAVYTYLVTHGLVEPGIVS